MHRWITAIALFAGVIAIAPRATADVIELTNGDRLSGTVVSRDAENLTLNHAMLGQIELPMAQIKAVRVDTDDVAPPSRAFPKARINTETLQKSGPSERSGLTEPAPAAPAAPAPAPAPAADRAAVEEAVVADADARPTFFKDLLSKWDSKLALGLNGAAGDNDIKSLYLRFDTLYLHDRDRVTINSQVFYTRTNGDTSQHQIASEVTRDWLQKDTPWFLFVKGQHKFDRFRAWRHRASGFGGAGYALLDNENLKLSARLGFGGTYEFGSVNEFTPEAMFGGSIAQWNLTERQTLFGEVTWFPSLKDEDHFRIVGKVWWQYKLDMFDGLSLKLGMEDEYDSRTQADDKSNDFKYYAALVLDF